MPQIAVDAEELPTGIPGPTYVPAGDAGTRRVAVQQGYNMRAFREFEQREVGQTASYQAQRADIEQILEVWEAEDWERVDRLCRQALADPQLPRLHRAQYNVFMSFCDQFHGTPRYFLDAAMAVVEDMEKTSSNGVGVECGQVQVYNVSRVLVRSVTCITPLPLFST